MRQDDAPAHLAKTLLERLARAQPVTLLGVRGARTSDIARIAASTGHDAIWVDLEHSTMPIDTAATICAAALDLGLFPFVRVPEKEYGVIGRLLDGGALGIIVPRIETADEAATAVAACRFPPLGHRSAIATLPHVGFRRLPAEDLNERLNRAVLVKVLIETPRGIANLESIANLPGVDIVGIGTNDLCAELGVAGDFRHPLVRQSHEAALAACRRAGKPLSIGGISDAAYAAELIRAGATPLLFTGIDTDLLLTAANQRMREVLAAVNLPHP
jgi:4-hydroxy-2-oxoheptanedioate aldolase